MAIKAIQTSYKGYRFRSRTEARWAVVFTELGLKWEYEPEGFELPSGRYLPDFWIPEWKAWVEVKGATPTDKERKLAQELCEALGQRVMIAIGTPEAGSPQFESAYLLQLILAQVGDEFVLAGSVGQWLDYIMPLPDRYVKPLEAVTAIVTPRINKAMGKARSARFEHGEKP